MLQLLAARKRPKEAVLQGKAVGAVVVHGLWQAFLLLRLPLLAEVVEVAEVAEALTEKEENVAAGIVAGNLQSFRTFPVLKKMRKES